MFSLTPIQIAVLAIAHDSQADPVAVWGSWQRAADALAGLDLLVKVGTTRGTRALEYKTLHGRKRRGKPGRLVHLYWLVADPHTVDLAARCAWAVQHKPKKRSHVTWKDVPDTVSTWPEGRRCPACLCTPSRPCAIVLEDGGSGQCVPAGAFGLTRCSACTGH